MTRRWGSFWRRLLHAPIRHRIGHAGENERDLALTAAERSLEEAAAALGVTLGEYYPHADAVRELAGAWDDKAATAARLDAAREELLTYIAGSRERHRQQRQRRLRAAALAVAALAVVCAVLAASAGVLDLGEEKNAPGEPTRGMSKLSKRMHSGEGVPMVGLEVSADLRVGSERVLGAAYVDLRDDVCSVIELARRGVTNQTLIGPCMPPDVIAGDLREHGALLSMAVAHEHDLFAIGYARAGMERVFAPRPRQGVDTAISGLWNRGDVVRRRLLMKVFLVRIRYPLSTSWRGVPTHMLIQQAAGALRVGYHDGSVGEALTLGQT